MVFAIGLLGRLVDAVPTWLASPGGVHSSGAMLHDCGLCRGAPPSASILRNWRLFCCSFFRDRPRNSNRLGAAERLMSGLGHFMRWIERPLHTENGHFSEEKSSTSVTARAKPPPVCGKGHDEVSEKTARPCPRGGPVPLPAAGWNVTSPALAMLREEFW